MKFRSLQVFRKKTTKARIKAFKIRQEETISRGPKFYGLSNVHKPRSFEIMLSFNNLVVQKALEVIQQKYHMPTHSSNTI